MASPVYGKSTHDIRKWLIKIKCRISKGVRARKACRQTDPPTGGVKKTLQLLSIPVARKRELVRELSYTYDANLLKNLDIAYPDHVWCDISYISLADGSTAYLAILMDIWMIRGWSLRGDLTESLVHEALSKALQTGHIPGIHHSDQGVQPMAMILRSGSTANGYDSRLLELDVKISMAGKGESRVS